MSDVAVFITPLKTVGWQYVRCSSVHHTPEISKVAVCSSVHHTPEISRVAVCVM